MITSSYRSRRRSRSACVDHKPRTLRVEPLEQRCMLSGGHGGDSDFFQLIRGELDAGVSYEAGLLYVTSDEAGSHKTSPGAPVDLPIMPAPLNVDGVADLIITRSDGTFRCTGSLLSSGQHVLTAAHCLTDNGGNLVTSQVEATWELSGGLDEVATSTVFTVHDGYNGDFFNVGNDLAIVEFASVIDAAVPRYEIIDTVTSEIDVVSVKVGYGRSGIGSKGDKLASGTKRAVLNEYDSDATPFGGTPGQANMLAYDFDSGNASNDGFEFHFNFDSDTGLGDDEGGSAPGDSGGPTFLWDDAGSEWVIGGVTSYGVKFGFGPFSSDVNKKFDSSWGEFGGDTRVSSFVDWIDPIISGTVNVAPVVSIDSPGDGATFDAGVSIVSMGFAGTASDAEDGDLTAVLAWTSSIDGPIDITDPLATLSDGNHTITAKVTDSGGKSGSDSITITVGEAPEVGPVFVESIDYDTEGGKNGDKHLLDTLTIVDGSGPVSGASVSITLTNNISGGPWNGTGTTGAGGTVTFSLKNAPDGCYTTSDVTIDGNAVTAPANQIDKGGGSACPAPASAPMSITASSAGLSNESVIVEAGSLFGGAELLAGTQDDSSTDDAPVRRAATARRAARPAFSRAAVDASMESMDESRSTLRHRRASRRMAAELPSELEELISAIS